MVYVRSPFSAYHNGRGEKHVELFFRICMTDSNLRQPHVEQTPHHANLTYANHQPSANAKRNLILKVRTPKPVHLVMLLLPNSRLLYSSAASARIALLLRLVQRTERMTFHRPFFTRTLLPLPPPPPLGCRARTSPAQPRHPSHRSNKPPVLPPHRPPSARASHPEPPSQTPYSPPTSAPPSSPPDSDPRG